MPRTERLEGSGEVAARVLEQLGLDDTVALPLRGTVTPEAIEAARTARSGAAPASLPVASVRTLPLLDVTLPGDAPAGDDSLGELVVQGAIGAGGMGAVYVAEQRSLGREVALKTLRVRSPVAEGALVLEGTITGKLEHPGIPPIHALGRAGDGRPVLVMKRIVGTCWVELLDDDAHPAWGQLRMLPTSRLDAHLRILQEVAEAVEFAHARGFLHRDVKPENVMVGQHGEVYLVDWGIATKLREDRTADVLVGTPAYLAPEMVTGGPLTVRTDVFLLGAALHYCLMRAPRHGGTSLPAIIEAAARCEPFEYPPSVPHELGALANQAMAREPGDRPASALAFREGLQRFFEERASNALAEAAGARLAELERLLAEGRLNQVTGAGAAAGDAHNLVSAGAAPPGGEAEELNLVRAIRLASEARFGFREALRESPRSGIARAGLERCLRASVRLECTQEKPAAARALLAELGARDAALEEEIARVERRLTRARREAERLRSAVQDADPAIAARLQRRFAVALAASFSALGIFALATYEPAHHETPLGIRYVYMGAFDLAVTLVAGAILRRRISANAMSRRMFAGLVAILGVFLVQRAFAVARGVPMWAAVATDNFILGTGTLALGLMSHRAWLAGGAVFVVTAIMAAAAPAWARVLGGFAGPLAATAGAATIFLESRRQESPASRISRV